MRSMHTVDKSLHHQRLTFRNKESDRVLPSLLYNGAMIIKIMIDVCALRS